MKNEAADSVKTPSATFTSPVFGLNVHFIFDHGGQQQVFQMNLKKKTRITNFCKHKTVKSEMTAVITKNLETSPLILKVETLQLT